MSRTRMLIQLVTFVFIAAWMGASPVAAQEAAWTTVGSAGTVDEEDLLLVQLGTPVPGAVSMRPVLRGALNVRYNVVAVNGLLGEATLVLTARYLDRGDGQRVFLELKEYNLNTGLTTTLLTLDSDAFPASDQFQTQSVGCEGVPFTNLDFSQNAYFVDAVISKFFPFPRPPIEPPVNQQRLSIVEPASSGPALGIIKLDREPCLL
jgi:hypothetical protein